jgi:molecular chaperone Hsp33
MPTAGVANLPGSATARNEDRDRQQRVATASPSGRDATREELLSVDADTVLRRLFWEERLARFDRRVGPSAPRFACSLLRASGSATC